MQDVLKTRAHNIVDENENSRGDRVSLSTVGVHMCMRAYLSVKGKKYSSDLSWATWSFPCEQAHLINEVLYSLKMRLRDGTLCYRRFPTGPRPAFGKALEKRLCGEFISRHILSQVQMMNASRKNHVKKFDGNAPERQKHRTREVKQVTSTGSDVQRCTSPHGKIHQRRPQQLCPSD